MDIFTLIVKSNCLNFIVVVAILCIVAKKIKLGSILQSMIDKVKETYEKSVTTSNDAKNNFEKSQMMLAQTPKEKEKILQDASVNAENIKKKIENESIEAQTNIKEGLQKIFDSQKEKITNLTVNELYNISIDIAKEEIIKRLDEKMQRKLIDNSIKELDKI